ncbi:MAG: hypothetical protein ACFFCQ_13355, partial [Promethearchaeota archaeon]
MLIKNSYSKKYLGLWGILLVLMAIPSVNSQTVPTNTSSAFPGIPTISVGTPHEQVIFNIQDEPQEYFYLDMTAAGSYNLSIIAQANINGDFEFGAIVCGTIGIQTSSNSYEIAVPLTEFWENSDYEYNPLTYEYEYSNIAEDWEEIFLPEGFSSAEKTGLTLSFNTWDDDINTIQVRILLTREAPTKISNIQFTETVTDEESDADVDWNYELDVAALGITAPGFYNITTSMRFDSTSVFSGDLNGNAWVDMTYPRYEELCYSSFSEYSSRGVSEFPYEEEDWSLIYIDPSETILIEGEFNLYLYAYGYDTTVDVTLFIDFTATSIQSTLLNIGQAVPINEFETQFFQLNLEKDKVYRLDVNKLTARRAYSDSPHFEGAILSPLVPSGFDDFDSFIFYYGDLSIPYLDIQITPDYGGISSFLSGDLSGLFGVYTYT